MEIGLEEIPARMIAGAEAELGKRVTDLLTRERLLEAGAKVTTYSTPRRLAVLVEGVLAAQADTEEQLTGPSWKVAFKDGAPTTRPPRLLRRRPASQLTALEKVTNAKGEYVGATVKRQGRAAAEVLTADLPKEVLGHLLGQEHVLARRASRSGLCGRCAGLWRCWMRQLCRWRLPGIAAGNASRGHRMLHGEAPVVIWVAEGLCRGAARGICRGRCGRAAAHHSQGAGQGDAHGGRRALARG